MNNKPTNFSSKLRFNGHVSLVEEVAAQIHALN